MAKAYWVATYRSVSNPDALAAYAKLAGPAIAAAGGRALARGLPEPFAKRTVEGDLGIRFNASHILKTAGLEMLQVHSRIGGEDSGDVALADHVDVLSQKVETVPSDDQGHRVDRALARTAVEIATARHAGRACGARTRTAARRRGRRER